MGTLCGLCQTQYLKRHCERVQYHQRGPANCHGKPEEQTDRREHAATDHATVEPLLADDPERKAAWDSARKVSASTVGSPTELDEEAPELEKAA